MFVLRVKGGGQVPGLTLKMDRERESHALGSDPRGAFPFYGYETSREYYHEAVGKLARLFSFSLFSPRDPHMPFN